MNNFDPSGKAGRTKRLVILLASIALLATACGSAANTNSGNTNAGANKNSTTNTTTSTSTSSTSSSAPAQSPIAAYKAFQDANKSRNYEAVKKSFSKASLDMLTEEAKKNNQTLDEYVKQQVDKARSDEVVSNEKISGDTATIELKDKDGTSSITLPMVVEDGAWKIAYDRFMKQMEDEFNKMSREAQKSADDKDTGANANK